MDKEMMAKGLDMMRKGMAMMETCMMNEDEAEEETPVDETEQQSMDMAKEMMDAK